MRFSNVRELKLDTNKVLSMSKKSGPVVVTRKGKPVAILRSIRESDLSINVGSLWDRIRESAERSGFGAEDVTRLIRAVRTKRKCDTQK
jgi:prevent-host-death family protein